MTTGIPTPSKLSPGPPILYNEAAAHLKKMEMETSKVVSPWPALHININKVEEKKVPEKSLQFPLLPLPVPDQLKCNILKAQIETASKASAQVVKEEPDFANVNKKSTLQDPNVRSPVPSIKVETTQPTTEKQEKQEIKPPRVRKLTRQYSFNHSDEDDLPPALAAAMATTASGPPGSPASQKISTPQKLEGQTQLSPRAKSPSDTGDVFTLGPGDLLMDFTEATPMAESSSAINPAHSRCYPQISIQMKEEKNEACMGPPIKTRLIKTFPADPSNPFLDPFTTAPQLIADFGESKLQCNAGKSSPLTPKATMRPLTDTVSTVQTIFARKPISLPDSAETLRQELEREKMMKRLLMTEL